MSVGGWITAHTTGWPIFLAASAALGVSAAFARSRKRSSWVPWLTLAIWLAAVAAFYVQSHVDRLRSYAPRMWSGQLLALGLAVAAPVLLVVLTLAVWSYARPQDGWRRAAAAGTFMGALGMTLAPSIALAVFGALHDWLAPNLR